MRVFGSLYGWQLTQSKNKLMKSCSAPTMAATPGTSSPETDLDEFVQQVHSILKDVFCVSV